MTSIASVHKRRRLVSKGNCWTEAAYADKMFINAIREFLGLAPLPFAGSFLKIKNNPRIKSKCP